MMKRTLSAITLSLLVATSATAAEKSSKTVPATVAPAATTTPAEMPIEPSSTLQTNVIGSKEAPTVYNIVPWKQTGEAKLVKKEVTTSILQESLQPLDPDVLNREIEFHRALNSAAP